METIKQINICRRIISFIEPKVTHVLAVQVNIHYSLFIHILRVCVYMCVCLAIIATVWNDKNTARSQSSQATSLSNWECFESNLLFVAGKINNRLKKSQRKSDENYNAPDKHLQFLCINKTYAVCRLSNCLQHRSMSISFEWNKRPFKSDRKQINKWMKVITFWGKWPFSLWEKHFPEKETGLTNSTTKLRIINGLVCSLLTRVCVCVLYKKSIKTFTCSRPYLNKNSGNQRKQMKICCSSATLSICSTANIDFHCIVY